MSTHYTITVRPYHLVDASPVVVKVDGWLRMLSAASDIVIAVQKTYGAPKDGIKMEEHPFENDGWVWTMPVDGEDMPFLEMVIDNTPASSDPNAQLSPSPT